MPTQDQKLAVLNQLKSSAKPLSLPEISIGLNNLIAERTLRRWLVAWVESGDVIRTGKKRGTRYQYATNPNNVKYQQLGFLQHLSQSKRVVLLEQMRNLWTHTSTAIEGNTLSLGDTHAILAEGMTVNGKPLREHHEIIGHAKAIDLIYQAIQAPLNKSLIFDLHKAVQTEVVNDIFKPMGAWKVEINGTNAVTTAGKQLFIEYAKPQHVEALMSELIDNINQTDPSHIKPENAARYYAKIHMAIAHIHPFWDGNGRITRLLANLLLLKAGLPPLIIDQAKRREYIECLADYQVRVGQITADTGVWPDESQLYDFELFCEDAYTLTRKLIDEIT